MRAGFLYVPGDLVVTGGITGKGDILVEGNVTVTGRVDLIPTEPGAGSKALIAEGQVTLLGARGRGLRPRSPPRPPTRPDPRRDGRRVARRARYPADPMTWPS